MESIEGEANEDSFPENCETAAAVLEATKKRSFSVPRPFRKLSAPRRVSSPLQQPPPIPVRHSKPRQSTDRSVDLDTVPKTEKLDTQVVSTRPKVPHNPPSRSHIHKRADDDELIPDKEKCITKGRTIPAPPSKPSAQPSELTPTVIKSSEAAVQVPAVSTTTPVSTEDSEDVVLQLKTELDSLKKEVETIKLFLTKEVQILKSDYKRDIEVLRQNLDEEHKKIASLQIEVEQLSSKTKGL